MDVFFSLRPVRSGPDSNWHRLMGFGSVRFAGFVYRLDFVPSKGGKPNIQEGLASVSIHNSVTLSGDRAHPFDHG